MDSKTALESNSLSRKSCSFIEDRVYRGTIFTLLVLAGQKCERIIAK